MYNNQAGEPERKTMNEPQDAIKFLNLDPARNSSALVTSYTKSWFLTPFIS